MNRTARIAGVAVAAASLLFLAGCSRTDTSMEYAPSDGTLVDTDDIALRNILVISNGEGGNALVGSITNKLGEPDTLVAVSVGTSLAPEAETPLPANGSVYFGSTDRTGLKVPGTLDVGGYVPVTFSFTNAGLVPASVLVVPNSGTYADAFVAATGLPAAEIAEPAPEVEEEGEGHSG